ncbi:MAG: hypothetical protein WCH57_06440 [Verrucomicrobiota bacterium]
MHAHPTALRAIDKGRRLGFHRHLIASLSDKLVDRWHVKFEKSFPIYGDQKTRLSAGIPHPLLVAGSANCRRTKLWRKSFFRANCIFRLPTPPEVRSEIGRMSLFSKNYHEPASKTPQMAREGFFISDVPALQGVFSIISCFFAPSSRFPACFRPISRFDNAYELGFEYPSRRLAA